MTDGWLFEPGSPAERPSSAPHTNPRSEPRGERAGDARAQLPQPAGAASVREVPLQRAYTVGHALGRLEWLLSRGAFAEALGSVDELADDLGRDAIGEAARAWALAGLGRLAEAEELILRAELHAARSGWQGVGSFLMGARTCLTAARKQARTRRPATRSPRLVTRPPRPPAAPPEADRQPTLPAAAVALPFRLAARAAPEEAAPHAEAAAEAVDPETALADHRLRAVAVRVDGLRRYDTLLSLGVARGVDRYDYQLRTVRRVLRDFRGRALLADEVGLGKTIEACLCLEEFLQRGLAKRALLLVPPGLLRQWQDELRGKFGREALIVTGPLARRDPAVWAREPLLLASLALARAEPHAARIVEAGFDMVIVDEAHRLKNRRTKLWRLVDRMRARYLLMLSATPVENDLIEIYNVLCLLRPGLFSTQADFKRRFVASGRRTPKDPDGLRRLLRQVMIRNTRATAEAKLPPRFATTLRAHPGADEQAFRARLDEEIRKRLAEGSLSRRRAGEILRAVGARPPAAARLIERHLGGSLGRAAAGLGVSAKDALLTDLLGRRRDDKVIVFAAHRESVAHLVQVVREAGRRPVAFEGGLAAAQKASAVEAFRSQADVLVATESGGEGFNLHFARTVVNYDLPWNPMRLEQRIGRVHRIGQTRDVFVFNLVAQGSLEEEILRVLDEKLDMFELVVGEVEAILGRLGDDEREFADLVLEIYAETDGTSERRARFDRLAERMVEARAKHVRAVALEDRLFGRELES